MPKKKKKNQGIVLIKKANDLIESRYKFDIWETRFFLSVLAQIRREDTGFEVYRVRYKDVIKNFGLKSGDSYGLLRAAAKSLMGKSFYVNYEDNGAIREKQYHILREIDYLKDGQEARADDHHEYVDVTVEQKMKPLLLQLQKNFTAYDLRNIVKLGVYPVRVYELLKQYESIGSRTLEVEEIKKMFEVTEQYKLFADFFRWVIQPSINEINDYTDLTITSVEKIKEGRKVIALRFVFHLKNREDLAKMRGAATPTQQIPLFPVKEAQEVRQELPETIAAYLPKLNDWWGVQQDEFEKRVGGKNEADIEAAVEFTKSRVKMGKAENPAGVFLDALAKGHKTATQIKAEKKAERERKEREKKERLQPLVVEYDTLTKEYSKAINDVIRDITNQHPAVTEQVIEKIKTTYKNLGISGIEAKTIENFRKNPMLRAAVKNEIMKDYPEQFVTTNDQYTTRIEQTKTAIKEIEPGFQF